MHILTVETAVYFAFLRTNEKYFFLPARKLHPFIILKKCD